MIPLLMAARRDVPSTNDRPGVMQRQLDAAGPCILCQTPFTWGGNIVSEQQLEAAVSNRMCSPCCDELDNYFAGPPPA